MSNDKRISFLDQQEDAMRELLVTYSMYLAARSLWSESATHAQLMEEPNADAFRTQLSMIGTEIGEEYRERMRAILDNELPKDWLDK